MYDGEGFNFQPSKDDKIINSAFQLIDFNGNNFSKNGVIAMDTLLVFQNQNP